MAAAAAAALVAALVGPAQAAGFRDEAYGLQVHLAGNEVIPATPFVKSTDGRLVRDAVVDLPPTSGPNPLAALSLPPQASGHIGAFQVAAQAGGAESRVADLDLGGPAGIQAELIDATCTKAHGDVQLVGLHVAGNDVGSQMPDLLQGRNRTVGVPDLLTITYNEQLRHSDGSLTVNALHVRLLPGLSSNQLTDLLSALNGQNLLRPDAGMTQLSDLSGLTGKLRDQLTGLLSGVAPGSGGRYDGTPQAPDVLADVIVASATCDARSVASSPTPSPSEEPTTPASGPGPSEAPVPTPVQTHHPVTG